MPYMGEIRIFGGTFPPVDWALCQGQSLAISTYDTLFQLIGTTYGGDGEETFNLPNLQGRVPVHQGRGPGISQTYQVGETGGVESVTLSNQHIPAHNHALVATTRTGTRASPEGNLLAAPAGATAYARETPTEIMASALQLAGGSQPHENMQPFVVVNFIICISNGFFPYQ
jgi:microcystin-dependent protein